MGGFLLVEDANAYGSGVAEAAALVVEEARLCERKGAQALLRRLLCRQGACPVGAASSAPQPSAMPREIPSLG